MNTLYVPVCILCSKYDYHDGSGYCGQRRVKNTDSCPKWKLDRTVVNASKDLRYLALEYYKE